MDVFSCSVLKTPPSFDRIDRGPLEIQNTIIFPKEVLINLLQYISQVKHEVAVKQSFPPAWLPTRFLNLPQGGKSTALPTGFDFTGHE